MLIEKFTTKKSQYFNEKSPFLFSILFLFYFTYRFSITGTSTACNVFGRRRDPGFNAPHPAAHPNLPKKSSFFSGKQIGAAQ